MRNRIVEAILSEPWMITQTALANIMLIATRDNDDLDAVESKLGRPLDNSHKVTIRDGVAVIPVVGPMFRYANIFTEISGATSVEKLALDFQTALDDPAVTAIMLAIDSPGGQANGINEFAKMVHAARDIKPVTAYVSGMGASAAYWIASAASQIIIDDTAQVGSVGVVMGFRPDDDDIIEFVSSQSPNKRPDIATAAGREVFQERVDAMAAVFVATVARNRGVSEEKVIKEFGQGDVLLGQTAVAVGMADKIGSHETVITHLSTAHLPKKENIMNAKDLAAQFAAENPKAAVILREEGATDAAQKHEDDITTRLSEAHDKSFADGQAAENDRIHDLEAAALPGFEALLATAKKDPAVTAGDLAVKIVAAQKEQGQKFLSSTESASQSLAGKDLPAPGAGSDSLDDFGGDAETDAKIWSTDPDLRAEFSGHKDAFLAYQQGQRNEAFHVAAPMASAK